ncbi:MAG TPA: hypothetical protein VEH47_02955, partial [Candidatus Acidoferrales bacterium]|nr:hypothetical protein [Candidatus Acidoferrales bacterium]
MKLGIENQKQVITLAVLGGLAVGLMVYEFWPPSPSAAPATTAPTGAAPAKPAMRRTSSGRMVPVIEPRLDPTLDLNLLSQSEEIKYAGNGRNIFVAGSVPKIEKPKATGVTDKHEASLHLPPPVPPPPPITLKFFGFANRPGETKKVFLSQGEDIFIAGEGDIVDRRYRVLHISATTVDVEDMVN